MKSVITFVAKKAQTQHIMSIGKKEAHRKKKEKRQTVSSSAVSDRNVEQKIIENPRICQATDSTISIPFEGGFRS